MFSCWALCLTLPQYGHKDLCLYVYMCVSVCVRACILAEWVCTEICWSGVDSGEHIGWRCVRLSRSRSRVEHKQVSHVNQSRSYQVKITTSSFKVRSNTKEMLKIDLQGKQRHIINTKMTESESLHLDVIGGWYVCCLFGLYWLIR